MFGHLSVLSEEPPLPQRDLEDLVDLLDAVLGRDLLESDAGKLVRSPEPVLGAHLSVSPQVHFGAQQEYGESGAAVAHGDPGALGVVVHVHPREPRAAPAPGAGAPQSGQTQTAVQFVSVGLLGLDFVNLVEELEDEVEGGSVGDRVDQDDDVRPTDEDLQVSNFGLRLEYIVHFS